MYQAVRDDDNDDNDDEEFARHDANKGVFSSGMKTVHFPNRCADENKLKFEGKKLHANRGSGCAD